MSFAVTDVSSWEVVADETAGADAKDWLTPPEFVASESRSQWWLFKEVKFGKVKEKGGGEAGQYRRNDDRVERVACELAKLLGLPAAQVELATRDGLEGCISRYVIPDGWAMYSGDALLSDFEGYVPCADNPKLPERIGHNLTNISALMEGRSGPPDARVGEWNAFDVFSGYLIFDAWIANTDRHAVNWGMLAQGTQRRLAPSFDHGSALGSGNTAASLTRALDDVPAWCERGYAKRFEAGQGMTLVTLAMASVELASPRAASWLHRLRAIERAAWQDVLRSVPGLSEGTCTFMDMVLAENQRRLCQ